MRTIMNTPILVFLLTFIVMWVSALIGAAARKSKGDLGADSRDDLGLILGATLTLLGLIIGFTFSMAVSRYDQRKNYEEAEANAIGTEFVRADLLPLTDAAKVRTLLRSYLDQRILFYDNRDAAQLKQINATTAQLQDELWNAVRVPAAAQPTPVAAVVLVGMNDVLNSQGYTQAAWWNRIPIAAWGLMIAISICSNGLVGYYSYHIQAKAPLSLILPLVLGISFFLIADIDSPRGGVIRVKAQNLVALSGSMHPN